jgi:TonB family protein
LRCLRSNKVKLPQTVPFHKQRQRIPYTLENAPFLSDYENMFLLFLAQAAVSPQASAPPPNASQASRPTPIFTMDDYPLAAIRNHWEGTAIAELTVNKEGRVSACKIVWTTGHKVLDNATCDLLMRRAKFTPATDKQGNPTDSVVRTPPIQWQIPR